MNIKCASLPLLLGLLLQPVFSAPDNQITVCSFNIQFLGASTRRDNEALASLLGDYDLVMVQELIAKPADTPSDAPATRQRAALFFNEMTKLGFSSLVSLSDTGPRGPLGRHTSTTEWWCAFYKSDILRAEGSLPGGFISRPLAANPDFDRVPYAFPFRTLDGRLDFVIISIHLNPSRSGRRHDELEAIGKWIQGQRKRSSERDYLIVGDANIQNASELARVTPQNFESLNGGCVATNVSPRSGKPYDHVFFNATYSHEVDLQFGFRVIDMKKAMASRWQSARPYPGEPYDPLIFRLYYSDHNPVVFRMSLSRDDD